MIKNIQNVSYIIVVEKTDRQTDRQTDRKRERKKERKKESTNIRKEEN